MIVRLGIDIACRAPHQASLASEDGTLLWTGRRFRTDTRPGAPTRLAYGRPVASATGSASMSARSSAVGPGPLRKHPDHPGAAHALGGLEPGLAQPGRADPGRTGLGERQLRVAVQVAVQVGERGHGTTLVAEPDQPDRRHPARGPSGRHRSGAQRSWSGGRSTRFSSGGP